MLGSSFSVGDHVVALRDLDGLMGKLGYPAVKRGTRGIVRERATGWFSDRYTVEFHRGGTLRVRGSDLRRPWSGARGELQWKRYKETKLGISLGIFVIFGLPMIVGLVPYYLHGGSTAELIAALPTALLDSIAGVIAAVGLPLAIIAGMVFWARARRRHR
jgi:hypothetical protein